MAAATADQFVTFRDGKYITPGVAASTEIFAGTWICYDADGYLVPAADTANFVFAGVAMEAVDNSGGADGDLNCKIRRHGLVKATFATAIAAANTNELMYSVDDTSLDLVGDTTNDIVMGRLVEFIDTTHGWVDMEDRA